MPNERATARPWCLLAWRTLFVIMTPLALIAVPFVWAWDEVKWKMRKEEARRG